MLLLAVVALSSYAHRLRGDPFVAAAEKLFETSCSCDCCITQNRLPGEQKNGLTLKCAKAPQGETSRCPRLCTPSASDMVLSASKGTVDLARFCLYKCRPLTETVGSMCQRQSKTEAQDMQDETGNGSADSASAAPLITGEAAGAEWSAAGEAQMAKQEAGKKVPEEAASGRRTITYDIGKVMTESRRAQAAANMANAAGALSRADVDAHRLNAVGTRVERAVHALAATKTIGVAADVAVQTDTHAAVEEADRAMELFHAAKMEARKVAKNAADETVKAIRSEIKDVAQREARADVKRFAWDKPDFWPRVLATKAGNPFLEQMVTATQRVAEYEDAAKSLSAKAEGAQNKAKKLTDEMNVHHLQGDEAGAEAVQQEIKTLLDSASSMQAQATQYQKIANDTRKTIPEWQRQAMMAAAYVAFDFSMSTKE